MTSRSWCFTLNNYTVSEHINIEETKCRYLVFGIEKGEKGTEHLQGYIEFEKPCRIASVKKLPGFERAHLEKRRGTREQARAYCQKDGEWLEFGDWDAGGAGTRNDLRNCMNAIKKGSSLKEIAEEMPETYSRNMRFVEKYKSMCEKEEAKAFRKLEVHVLWGEAGTGKSRKAIEENPNIFTVEAHDSFPFDGYDGEKEILIDDFDGSGIPHCKLLRILDGHRFRVNVKGGHRWAQWNKVIITSNKPPDQWYHFGLKKELKRRLTSVTEFTLRGEEVILDSSPLQIIN